MKKMQKRVVKKLLDKTAQNKQVFNFSEFIKKTEVPVIPITINNKEYIVLIDTGSDASYLDSTILESIPKELLGHQNEIIGGTAIKDAGSAVYKVNFTCGSKEFTDAFTENDFSQIFNFLENSTGVRLHGILGTRFLMKYKCILDFDKLVFYL